MRLKTVASNYGWVGATVALLVASPALAQQPAIHVDGSLQSNGDGVSWSTAFNSLHAAFGPAQSSGLPIWVKAGTYRPHADDRNVSFTITAPVVIYGGFAGNETVLEERDIAANPTILDGDIDHLTDPDTPDFGDRDGNSHHVVRVNVGNWGSDAFAVLDGLIIRGGNADGSEVDRVGGGVLLTTDSGATVTDEIRLRVLHCLVTDNTALGAGGGLCAYRTTAEFRDSVIDGNRVEGVPNSGGILRILGGAGFWASRVVATRTDLVANRAIASPGGGAYVELIVELEESTDPSTFVNVRFIENRAGETGGGLNVFDGDAELANCLFARNHAEPDGASPSGNAGAGGGLAVSGTAGPQTVINVVNCTFADNIAVNDLPSGGGGPGPGPGGSTASAVVGVGAGAWKGQGMPITIRNSVFWGNRVTVGAPSDPQEVDHHEAQVNVLASGTVAASPIAYSNIENNVGCGSSCTDPAPDDWLNIGHVGFKHDPLFVDPPSNNYLHRTIAMAATGSNDDLPDDVNDVDDNGIANEVLPLSLVLGPRVLDVPGPFGPEPGTVDMGAYEWCPGDFNGDGVVDGNDLGDLLNNWGPCDSGVPCLWDLTGDHEVGGADLGLLLNNWDCVSTAPSESMLLSGGFWIGDYLAGLLETYGFDELWELLEWLDELEPWERELVFADLLV